MMRGSRLLASAQKRWNGLPVWAWAVVGTALLAVVVVVGAVVGGDTSSPAGGVDKLASGRGYVEAGQYAEAIIDLKATLAAHTDWPEVYYWLFLAYSESGDVEEGARVLADLESAADAGRGGVESWYWLLRGYSEKGDM